MRSLGPSGKIRKTDYRDWPIFKNYRQSTQFLASYESVFGEPFSQIVIAEESDEGDDEPGSGALNVSTHG